MTVVWAAVSCLMIAGVLPVVLSRQTRPKNKLENFRADGILTDMNIKMPTSVLTVKYGSVKVKPGMVLTPSQVQKQPVVKWKADQNAFYTIVMNDPDAPSRADPKFREWHHWCVVNIPGKKLAAGEILTSYMGSAPPKGTGLHRYVLLLFRQPSGRAEFSEKRLISSSGEGRASHHVSAFAAAHSLGDPVAGNYFQAEWEG